MGDLPLIAGNHSCGLLWRCDHRDNWRNFHIVPIITYNDNHNDKDNHIRVIIRVCLLFLLILFSSFQCLVLASSVQLF